MLYNGQNIAEYEAYWLMGFPIINLWGARFTSIFSVFSVMAGWIAEIFFMLSFACVTNATQKIIQQSTAACRAILDKAAQKAIDSSQRIFLAHDCVNWNVWLLTLSRSCLCIVYLIYIFIHFFFTFLAIPILCIFVFLCSHMCPRWIVTVCVFWASKCWFFSLSWVRSKLAYQCSNN